MKFFASNPLVQQSIERIFTTTREVFNASDERMFRHSIFIAYINDWKQEIEFTSGCIIAWLSSLKIDPRPILEKYIEFTRDRTKKVFEFSLQGKNGKVIEFIIIVMRIYGFSVDLEKKKMTMDLPDLVRECTRFFAKFVTPGLPLEAVNERLKQIGEKTRTSLVDTGVFRSVQ